MNILDFYNKLENNLTFDELKGKVTINENKINWKYSLDMGDDSEPYYDEIPYYAPSLESKLYNIYILDVEIIESIIDGYSLENEWVVTEPEVEDDEISFNIVKV